MSAYSIENIQLLIKSIQYRTYSYKFIYLYSIFVYFSLIIEYVSLYTIFSYIVYTTLAWPPRLFYES